MKNKGVEIALFGTSADPPTFGHQALLVGLSNLYPKVVTWASDNPMKCHGASLYARQNLLNALVEGIGNPNLKMVQELSSPRTIKTIEKAKSLWPTSDLIFVIGSDLAKQIPSWIEPKTVLRSVRLGIAPRKGWPLESTHIKTLEALGAQIEILPLTIPATASSSIRCDSKTSHIPPILLPQLLEQNLYGLNGSSI